MMCVACGGVYVVMCCVVCVMCGMVCVIACVVRCVVVDACVVV